MIYRLIMIHVSQGKLNHPTEFQKLHFILRAVNPQVCDNISTQCWCNVGLRYWPNINPASDECVLLTELLVLPGKAH